MQKNGVFLFEISFFVLETGLLTGCGKKMKIVRFFGGELCGTKS